MEDRTEDRRVVVLLALRAYRYLPWYFMEQMLITSPAFCPSEEMVDSALKIMFQRRPYIFVLRSCHGSPPVASLTCL
jgi:hypothetical protein